MKYILLSLLFVGLTNCNQNDSITDALKKQPSKNKLVVINKTKKLRPKKFRPSIVIMQPFSGVSGAQVNYIFKKLKKIIPQVVLNNPIALPQRAYYKPRNRYRADTLNFILKKTTKNGYVTIGLTNKDLSTDNGNIVDWGVMGLAYVPGKSCTVSPFRLSKKNINEQYFKVAIHELGHTQGLPHCADIRCLMTDAKGKNNTDKEEGFCEKCKSFLVKKGWKL